MSEYEALVAYIGVTVIVFIGGLIWGRYRTAIKRRLSIADYRPREQDNHPDHTPVGGRV